MSDIQLHDTNHCNSNTYFLVRSHTHWLLMLDGNLVQSFVAFWEFTDWCNKVQTVKDYDVIVVAKVKNFALMS